MVFLPRDILDEFNQRWLGQSAELTKQDLNQTEPPPIPTTARPTPEPPPQDSPIPSLETLRGLMFGSNAPASAPGQGYDPSSLGRAPTSPAAPAPGGGGMSIGEGVPSLDLLRQLAFGSNQSQTAASPAPGLMAQGTQLPGSTDTLGQGLANRETLPYITQNGDIPSLDELRQRAFGTTPKPQPQASMPQPYEGLERVGAGMAATNQVSQFDASLSNDDAYAACGPAAAVRFASKFGRNPSLSEAVALAREVGWTPQQGMAGLGSEKQLMDRMGVPTKLIAGPQWDQFASEAQTGNPVTISTSAHYFFADGYNPQTGQFHVGRSGTDLRGGKEWMTRQEIEDAAARLGGGQVQGALFADNPTVAARSNAAAPTGVPSTGVQTTAGLSGGGELSGQAGTRAQEILGGAANIAGWLGEQGQKALQSVLITEGGLENARGDSGQSAGPLQFFEGGQLANYARSVGLTLEQAKQYVEQHPLEAITWAIGVPSNPGYLGKAILDGMSRNLSGADLATYAQEHGQVSVSPERAGQNFNALFGAGQSLLGAAGNALGQVPGAQQVVDVYGNLTRSADVLNQQAQALTGSSAAVDRLRAEREAQEARQAAEHARSIDEINQQNQALTTSNEALSQRSVQAAQNVAQPTIAPTAAQGEQPLWERVTSAVNEALKPILEQLGAPPVTAPVSSRGAAPQGVENEQLTAGAPQGHLPTPAERLVQTAQQNLERLGESLGANRGPGLGPSGETPPSAAVGALDEFSRRVQSPTPEAGQRPGTVGVSTALSGLGTLASAAGERLATPSNYLADITSASTQRSAEYIAGGGPQLEAEMTDLAVRLQDGDTSVQPRMEEIGRQLDQLQHALPTTDPAYRRDIWYQTPTEVREGLGRVGGDFEQQNLTPSERNPEQERTRTATGLVLAAGTAPLAVEGAPLAARVIAEVLQPGTNPIEIVRGAQALLRGPAREALGAAARPLEEAVANYQKLQLEQAPGRRAVEAGMREVGAALRPSGALEAPGLTDALGGVVDALRGAQDAIGRVPGLAARGVEGARGLAGAAREALPRVAEALGGAPRAGAVAGENLPPISAAAPRLIEPEARVGITEGGLGTPRYPYAEGTPEAGVQQAWRDKAVADPNGVANFTADEMSALPAQPRPAGPGVPKWQEGHAVSSTDLRNAVDQGMPQAQWYSKFADGVADLVGRDNINEFRSLFGITSQQTAPVDNLAYALGLMRMGREFTRDGTAFTPQNIAAWTRENPIRLGGSEGWSDRRIARWIEEGEGKRSVDADGTRYGGWGVGGAQFKKIADVFNKGQVTVESNAKTSSYSQNILSALLNKFDPNSTMDTWMAQLFNYRDPKLVANTDAAYRSMREVVGNLAGELGMNPHQLQAAMWFSIKAAKDFARSATAPKEFKQLVRDFTDGKASLSDVVAEAKRLGAYEPERLSGTWEESIASPQVSQQIEALRDILHLPSTEAARNAYIQYPGQGKKLFPVTPETTAARRAFAEGAAPSVAVRLGDDVLSALGYDPERKQFSALSTIPHIVDETTQGHQVMLPGGNIETAQYVGARIGEAAGADEVGIHLFEPEAQGLAGWRLTNADGGALSPEQSQYLRDALDANNVQYSQPTTGIIRVHALDVADPAYEQAVFDAATSVEGVRTLDLKGVTQRVGSTEFPEITQRLEPRYGAAGRPGVPEPRRHLGPEGLPLEPPRGGAAAGVDTRGAVSAGRAGPSLESGAGAAAAESGARPLAAPVQRVVRGPLGRPAPVGGAEAEAGGAAGRPLELARTGESAAGGGRPAAAAPDPLTGHQGAVRERFDPSELPVGPHTTGEEVPGAVLPDGSTATRLTTWDDDDLVRTRAEMKSVPETITQYPEGHPERELQRAAWEDQLYGQGAVRKEKKLDIITGLPAVGKSSIIADPLVAERGAFLADNDLAKEIIPEFDGGRGAGVVHEESSLIGDRVYRRALQAGDNIVLPMLGGKREKLDKLVDEAKALGYEVRLHLLDAPSDVSARNNIERFHKRTPAAPKGRFVDTTIIESNDDKPRQAFEQFIGDRAQDLAGHSRIKNSGIGKLDMIVDQNAALPDKVQRMMRNGRINDMPIRPPRGAGFLQTGRLPEGAAQPYVRGAVAGGLGAKNEAGEEATPQDVAAGAIGGMLFAKGQKALRASGLKVSPVRTAQAISGATEAVRGGQAARSELGMAINTATTAGGAVAGYQSTPEEASPLERAGRTIVGAGAGHTAGRVGMAAGEAALRGGAKVPGRTVDLDALADMRRQAQRAATAPPPPPSPGSKEWQDYLQDKGKWAPPAEGKASLPDHIVAYTTANMLSGLGTNIQNLIGGTVQNAYRPLELAASGNVSDAAHDVLGMVSGMGEHFARFGHTFKTGERYSQTVEARSKGLPGGLKNPLNYPLRTLAATDEFMRSAAASGAQAAEASRLLRENPGMSFKDVLAKHQDQILEAGVQAGKEATFETGGGLLGTAGAKMAEQRQKLLNSDDKGEQALGVVMQWLLPMTRVPGVIFGKGLRSVPVINEATGAVNIVRHLKAGDTSKARREFAKTYLTTMANMAILDQVQQGNITGDGPDNAQDRARLMEATDAEGNPVWRPNSIKIGGRWFDHNALGPISFSMGSIANLVDEAKDYAQTPPEKRGEPPALVGDLLRRQAKTVSNAWYLRNVADILGAVKDGNVAGIGQELVSSGDRLVPMGGLLNEIRRIEDPYAREVSKELPRGIIEREANRLPWASRTVAPRLTATTGQPVEQPRDILSTLVRGSAPGMTPNPVAREVSALTEGGNRVSVPLEDDLYKGAKQTTDQLRAIRETTGQAVNMYVLDTMRKPEYQKLTDPQKADALSKAVNQAKEASNITLGGQVARSPHESALWQYATEPHYYGVKGTPEEVARMNWEIDQARAKRAEYARRYPHNYEQMLQREDPDAFRLVIRYEPLEKERLDQLKRVIDKATGGAYYEEAKQAGAGGLVGVGASVLPQVAPRRPAA